MEDDWEAVAQALNLRMAELNVSQRELAERSGISPATLRQLQHGVTGRRRTNRTLSAVSRALGWRDDHLVRVLRGTPPAPPPVRETGPDLGEKILAKLDAIHKDVRALRHHMSEHPGPPD